MKLSGITTLLTGATGRLGTCLVHAFWEAGANLILVARSPQRLTDLLDRLPSHPSQRAIALVADLSDPQASERIVAEARQTFDTLEVLINCAAIQGPVGPFWDNDWQEWQLTIQVNLLAPIALCRVCIPWMTEHGGGRIINLSGGGGTAPRPNFSGYAAAKAGLIRFSETLADETRHLGIRVNCVAPGAMDSALSAMIIDAGPRKAGEREFEHAMKVREGGGASPERAAALCVFLASALSDGITGKLISAVWDTWETLPSHLPDLQQTDVYTLRRIVPKDRGLEWGNR